MVEVFIALAVWLSISAAIILLVVVVKLASELKKLVDSCRNWVAIYFPPHINEAAQDLSLKTQDSSKTHVTINRGWDENEPPRD